MVEGSRAVEEEEIQHQEVEISEHYYKRGLRD